MNFFLIFSFYKVTVYVLCEYQLDKITIPWDIKSLIIKNFIIEITEFNKLWEICLQKFLIILITYLNLLNFLSLIHPFYK